MKWTAEADLKLFMAIHDIHNVKVDTAAVGAKLGKFPSGQIKLISSSRYLASKNHIRTSRFIITPCRP